MRTAQEVALVHSAHNPRSDIGVGRGSRRLTHFSRRSQGPPMAAGRPRRVVAAGPSVQRFGLQLPRGFSPAPAVNPIAPINVSKRIDQDSL